MIKSQKSKVKSQKFSVGFSLVETLVALGILAFVSTGLTLFVSSNSRITTLIQDQTVAINLAQEGLEVVRNIRDSKWISGGTFSSALPVGVWQVQWDSFSLAPDSNQALKFSVDGIYQYTSGTSTKFKRKITITDVSLSEKKIVVSVSWPVRGGIKTIPAELRLFDWK
ncbi:MAG: type II secretion system protein [Parcubacteria group bacterium]|nr:type II secretion system protein [Parcubacteria group bacterium]